MPISLINKNAKILNKILTNRFQQSVKIITYQDQVTFILDMQVWFYMQKSINIIYHINRLKKKNCMIISIDAEEVLDKIQHSFIIKILSKQAIEGNLHNLINNI